MTGWSASSISVHVQDGVLAVDLSIFHYCVGIQAYTHAARCRRLGAYQDDARTNCMRQSQNRDQRQSQDKPQQGLDNPLAHVANEDGLQGTAGSECHWHHVLGVRALAEVSAVQ